MPAGKLKVIVQLFIVPNVTPVPSHFAAEILTLYRAPL
ncbi:hypothetical protein SeKA_A4060 [Salmonella enterica subsp. enterica serovar Kentucky str. CVM29188]|nr:hypothetical protein SeKA_A4060 [Salmonella enterica subsp. enterica serovar Kentucky str. CVM29188]EDZ21117.1 hypothetical protein SeKB_A4597 [Salmonella enterica subsp. enterica serovar Kentucky str. CDC 191]